MMYVGGEIQVDIKLYMLNSTALNFFTPLTIFKKHILKDILCTEMKSNA